MQHMAALQHMSIKWHMFCLVEAMIFQFLLAHQEGQESKKKENLTVYWIEEVDRKKFGIVAGHAFANVHSSKPFDVLEGPEYNADARIAHVLAPNVPLVVRMHTPTIMVARMNLPLSLRSVMDRQLRNVKRLLNSLMQRSLPEPWHWHHYFNALSDDEVENQHAMNADMVVSPCVALCDFAEKVWRIPREKIRHAPYPYVPSNNLLCIQPRPEGKTVGFVGRLETRKGIQTIAAAIPAVLKKIPDAKFVFYGAAENHPSGKIRYDDWLVLKLKKHIPSIEIAGKVGWDKIDDIYESIDVCVFPSHWENFPNVCLESMSSARAIVASSRGGMLDMLTLNDGSLCGRLINPRDSSSLASNIIYLLSNQAERIRLGHLARERVLSAYSADVVGEMMESIYNQVVKKKSNKHLF